eukprot:98352-Rhodomonas_salina.6
MRCQRRAAIELGGRLARKTAYLTSVLRRLWHQRQKVTGILTVSIPSSAEQEQPVVVRCKSSMHGGGQRAEAAPCA